MSSTGASARTGDGQPPRRQPGRPPDAEARGRILEALRRLVTARDYDDVPVEDLLREAGVSRATYYKHFESKDQALVALFTEVAAGIRERTLAAAARGGDLPSMLDSAVPEYLRAILTLGKLAPAFDAAQFRSSEMREARETTLRQYAEQLTSLLRAAGRDPIPPLLLDALFAAVDRVSQRLAATRPAGSPVDALVERTMTELREQLRSFLPGTARDRPTRATKSPSARPPPRRRTP